jgi:hypothetical protein
MTRKPNKDAREVCILEKMKLHCLENTWKKTYFWEQLLMEIVNVYFFATNWNLGCILFTFSAYFDTKCVNTLQS